MANIDREMLDTFIEESNGRLLRIECDLEKLHTNPPLQMETVNALFREIHSLKSAANLVGLAPIEKLAHKIEDILGKIRNGEDVVDEELVEILKAGFLRINDLVENPQVLSFVDVSRDVERLEHLLVSRYYE